LLLVLWLIVLALSDAVASHQYGRQLRRQLLAETAKLEAELRRRAE
jgi:hypothetical protein